MSQAVSFDTFCPVEFGHDTEMPKNNYYQILRVICSPEQLPPYILLSYNRRLLTTLLSNRVWFYPSAKAINGRETYERRAKEPTVLSPGQSTERCLHDYLRPATRTLVSDRVGHKDLAGDALYLAQEQQARER